MDEIQDTPTDRAALAAVLRPFAAEPDAIDLAATPVAELNTLWARAASTYYSRRDLLAEQAALHEGGRSDLASEVEARAGDLLAICQIFIWEGEHLEAQGLHNGYFDSDGTSISKEAWEAEIVQPTGNV